MNEPPCRCPTCNGSGWINFNHKCSRDHKTRTEVTPCPHCPTSRNCRNPDHHRALHNRRREIWWDTEWRIHHARL